MGRLTARIARKLRRKLAKGAEGLVSMALAHGSFSEQALRRWVRAAYANAGARHILVNELAHRIKVEAPGIERVPFDLAIDGEIGFEHLMGLFSSTTLDEWIATMNVRQSAYLFGLIRRKRARRVIEVGRQWGGATLLIAAAMRGQGEFWSIDDPARLDYDVNVLGRSLHRPVEHQVADLCRRLGLRVHILVGDSRALQIETGPVDLVFIDGDHSYAAALSDFERFGTRVRVGGAVLFDDAVYDDFSEPSHTADVKKVVREVEARGDFARVKTVKRLVHFERIR
jgi:predicted O-methyltransferase YrrM